MVTALNAVLLLAAENADVGGRGHLGRVGPAGRD
jgi:hypothetical protein